MLLAVPIADPSADDQHGGAARATRFASARSRFAEQPRTPSRLCTPRRSFAGVSRGLVVVCCVVVGVLLGCVGSAEALNSHVYESSFGAPGSGAGQFAEPSGVAVDEVALGHEGDVYVADTGNDRVQWLSPNGKELKGQFDGSETPAGSFSAPTAIAVDNSTSPFDPSSGDVYVLDSGHKVIDKFDAGGKYAGQITTGAGGEPFGELDGVAVDPEGLLWVYQASGEIDSYSSAEANQFLADRSSPFGTAPGLAVDAHDDLYVKRFEPRFAKINSAGGSLIEAMDAETSTAAAVNEATGEVLIDNLSSVAVFDEAEECTTAHPCENAPAGALLSRFGAGHLTAGAGVAIDATSGLVFVADSSKDEVEVFRPVVVPGASTGAISEVATGSVTLNGEVNPSGLPVTSCQFEYGPTTAYGHTAECSPKPGAGTSNVPVSARLSGLALGTYYYRLVAANANGSGEGLDRSFQAGATVEGEASPTVEATEATLTAQIDAAGLPTTYHVEYGPTAAYGSSTPEREAGAPDEAVTVTSVLSKLNPGSEYHYRFVATNAFRVVDGADMTFTTPTTTATAAERLPDGRAYELVSPANSREIYAPSGEVDSSDLKSGRPYRAAADGDAVTYAGEPPVSGEGGNGSEGSPFGNEYLSTRGAGSGPSGWETADVTPLARNVESGYQAFSEDLTVGIFADANAFGEDPPLTESAPGKCTVLYSRTASGFAPLFGAGAVREPGFCGYEHEPLTAGGNEGTASVPAFSDVLLETAAALTPESSKAPGEGEQNLYVSLAGRLSAVNVVGGKPVPNATFGGPSGEVFNASDRPDYDDAISDDGARVFWSAVEREGEEVHPTALYARENPTSPAAMTVQLDEAEAGASGASGDGQFWAASKDGSKVLFTDCNQLVVGSTAENAEGCYRTNSNSRFNTFELSGSDLYEYDFSKPVGERLTDLTIDHTDPEGADVQGVVATSANGEYVYFVADGVLASNTNGREEAAHAGQPNLYVLHAGDPATFIATLEPYAASGGLGDDYLRGEGGAPSPAGDWRPGLGQRTATTTPDGRSLVFESHLPLTGYNNAAEGKKEAEIFLYEASSARLVCVSCSPSGAPVMAFPHRLVGSETYFGTNESRTFTERSMNEAGTRVFFNTIQPLVRQDTNGHVDVYEWEREGEGSCPPGSLNGGCVYLISGGTSDDASNFTEASANGDDVFFTTRGQLVPQDRDDKMDLYDARVGGGFPGTELACTGTGCQGVPPAPPTFATPASVTFSGSGNYPPAPPPAAKPKTAGEIRAERLKHALSVCKAKKRARKRVACERSARARYGTAKHARTTHDKAKRQGRNGKGNR
jgi:hypothetical protein